MEKAKSKTRFYKKVLPAIGLTVVALGLIGFVLRVYHEISSGHGLDTYYTAKGIQVNYIGVGLLLILIPIVVIVGWLINLYITRDERQLKKEAERRRRQLHENGG